MKTKNLNSKKIIKSCFVIAFLFLSSISLGQEIEITSVSPTTFCANELTDIQINIEVSGFSGNKTYTAQLSDVSGSFSNPSIFGTVSFNTNTTSTGTIIGDIDQSAGSDYLVRVVHSQGQTFIESGSFEIEVNPSTVWYFDDDNDGYGDPNDSVQACSQPTGYVDNDFDCDDTNADINPDTVWYLDADDDGYYTGTGETQCASPGAGFVYENVLPGDCNDNDAAINPGASEICDGI
ncbi:MAG: putative metal-binding motif-containing protein, partial [Flavobacteriaceae bacterium]